jgi:K+-transporting ATPase ATPase A chain
LFILGGTALFAATAWGASTLNNPASTDFQKSSTIQFGSGQQRFRLEGLGENTVPLNVATGTVMLLARFIPIILPWPSRVVGRKKPAPKPGHLAHGYVAVRMVILGSVVFIGALLFLPVAVLGPIAEHLCGWTLIKYLK